MNADQLTQFLDQVQRLWETHVPPEYQVPVLPVAVGSLLLGIGLSVLGAKLARVGVTLGFVAVGVLLASALAPIIHTPVIAVVLIGALLAGGIGYALFRLWVGLAAAAFFAAIAVGTYGSQVVVPRFIEYDPAYKFNGTFTLPDKAEGDTTSDRVLSDLQTWADDFWLYVQSREVDVNKRIWGMGLGAALIGLVLGMLLPRFTLIVATSMVGTLMVMSGLAGLAAQLHVDLPAAAGQHGRILAVAGIVFLGASLLLQMLLTRKAPPRKVVIQTE
jgi:hypothetical protein